MECGVSSESSGDHSQNQQRKRKYIHDEEEEGRKRLRISIDTQSSTVSTMTSFQLEDNQDLMPPKVWKILTQLYRDVSDLYTWVTRLDIEGLDLVQEGDPQGYIHLLHNTYVCKMETQKVQPPTSLSQASHQSEVLLRVIQRLKRKNTSNVLSLGFEYISDYYPHAHILGHTPALESRQPNSAFIRLQCKPWRKLLSRIGDELMTRLLERTSLVYSVPPSNFVQLTGVPIYEMCPMRGALQLSCHGKKEIRTKSKPTQPKARKKQMSIRENLSTVADQTPNVSRGAKQKHEEGEKRKRKRRKKNTPEREEIEHNFKPFEIFDMIIHSPYRRKQIVSRLFHPEFTIFPKLYRAWKVMCLSIPLTVVDSPSELCKLILGESVIVQPQKQQQPQPSQQQQQQQPQQEQQQNEQVPLEGSGPKGDTAPQKALEDICKNLIQNHMKCKYKVLLNYYCGTKSSTMCRSLPQKTVPVYSRGVAEVRQIQFSVKRSGQKRQQSIGQLLDSMVSVRQIFLFVRALCLRVIPLEMFGDSNNRKVFFKHLKEILGLGRHETYSLGHVMMNVKVTAYKCMDGLRGHLHRVRTVAQIHWWLLQSYIFPVIKAFFYVTETSLYKNRLVYYRKCVWLQIHARALKDHLKRKMLTPITQEQVEVLLESGQVLGVSNLRFLPKMKSLRPVVNMGQKPEPWTKKKLSINAQLRTVLSILQYHVQQNSALVQSGKFGIDDISVAYRKFILRRLEENDTRPLYYVKTDINKCFDNILQDKLFAVVKDIVMSEDSYITRRSAGVILAGNKLKRIFHKQTFTLTDYEPDFRRFVQNRSKVDSLNNTVLVDQVFHVNTTAEQALTVLKNHLFNNIIKIGKRFYRQTVGIGQGSVLSTLLCTLYSASMEQKTTAPPGNDELMLRWVDDNLYITPYRDKVVTFLNTALKGNKDYNLYSNMDKVLINFDYHHPDLGSVPAIDNTAPFPWCGMLLDTQGVSVDYSRYDGQAIRDTITLDFSTQSGLSLQNKLLLTMRSRCHSLYLDPQINSVSTRINNVYKACLLSAYKLHCYVLHVWPARRRKNHVFLKNVILKLAQYIHSRQELALKDSNVGPETNTFPLSFALIRWLCVQAYIMKLKQHHSMYAVLITLLKRYRKGFWGRMSSQDRQAASYLEKKIEQAEIWSRGLGR